MNSDNPDLTLPSRGSLTEAASCLAQGSKIGRYVVLETLGEGGMGVVYKAYDPQLNRGVALKLIRPRGDGQTDSQGSARLLREAQALALLTHPNVVAVHDVGTLDGQVFVAMELVAGKTLRGWYKEDAPSIKQILEVMRAAGAGLAAAHRAGLIHRDFKPSNVILGEDGRVRVIDFGLARAGPGDGSLETSAESLSESSVTDAQPARDVGELEGASTRVKSDSQQRHDSSGSAGGASARSLSAASLSAASSAASSSKGLLVSPLTHVGAVVGTPVYMAPEQHRGRRVDARADQFAFCVVLYEVLYGKRPFSGRSVQGYAANKENAKLTEPPADSNVPRWLHKIVVRGLARDLEHRYPTMDDLLEQLDADPEEIMRRQQAARKRRLLATAATLSVLLAVVGVMLGREYMREQTILGCKQEGEAISAVWSKARVEKIAQAFGRSGASYATDSLSRARPFVDAYVREWTQARREVCLDGEIHDIRSSDMLERARACFDERKATLAQLADQWEAPNATVTRKALSMARSLPTLRPCIDETELSMREPAVEQPQAEASIQVLRDKLAAGSVLQETDSYEQALELAQSVLDEATKVEHTHLTVSARLAKGRALTSLGRYKEAQEVLRTAFCDAEAAADDFRFLKVSSVLILTAGIGLQNERAGKRWYRLADTKRARLGLPVDHRVMIEPLGNIALLLRSNGEYEKALERYEQALAIQRTRLGSDHPGVAVTLRSMGRVLSLQGKVDEAVAAYRKAFALDRKALGTDHPTVALDLHDLALAMSTQGQHSEASTYLAEALKIMKEAVGPDGADVAWPLSGMGRVLVAQGQPKDAQVPLRHVVEICQSKTCAPEPHAHGLFALAQAYAAIHSNPEQAIAFAKKALSILTPAQTRIKQEIERIQSWLKQRGVLGQGS